MSLPAKTTIRGDMKKSFTLIAVVFGCIFFSVPIVYGEGFLDRTIGYLEGKKIDAMDSLIHHEVRGIASGIEMYVSGHDGVHPQNIDELTKGDLPLVNSRLFSQENTRSEYSIEYGQNSWKVTGAPKECGKTGNKIFLMKITKFENPCGADIQPLKRSDFSAKMALAMFDAAIEEYISNNDGTYPGNETDIKQAFNDSMFPGLSNIFDDTGETGYKYTVEYRPNGYKIIAEPKECGKTGTRVFTKEIIELEQPCKNN